MSRRWADSEPAGMRVPGAASSLALAAGALAAGAVCSVGHGTLDRGATNQTTIPMERIAAV